MGEGGPARGAVSGETVEAEWLGSSSEMLRSGVDSSLKHVCRREYAIECNWKVWPRLSSTQPCDFPFIV